MRKVLITGAAGFIGSHLCDKFLDNNSKVVGIDNFITGDWNNISHLEENKNFQFIEKDVTESFELSGKFDLVLHFACPASPVDYLKHPIETLKVDSLGTFHLLEIAKESNSRFILASTSEIYGDPIVHPQKEEYWGNVNSVGIRSVYDEAKRFSEACTMAFYREYELDVRIPRIFNTYGPRMQLDDGRVVPNFISQALANEDITIYGEGSQTRSFCYIDDLIEGIFNLSIINGLNGVVMNLGSQEEYRILDFADVIIEKLDSKSKKKFLPLPEDDPKQRCPDINKAQRLIGWTTKTSLDEGLKNTIDYFKNIN
ncbi:UDP-glucuronic acid decarboxylase family protein [Methanobacterium spitsbergense]|uniref:UDP-glucuronate decarboxylase n=1 Tax=Methanobacterium spitsbergense TaxID=2874285 RepID=A0A8T5V0T4_9EURY|nr:UDP-glucuronic acid decarboxylase family protein [Methanobacterium spitsbergense]MBZ2167060.1 SDR family oxidoreductase [Methanobacterium spitsbergense]